MFSSHISAQVIIAGESGLNTYYTDLDPDITIYGIHNTQAQTFNIDINKDYTLDFKIKVYNVGGLGGGSSAVSIIPFNKNEISISHIDSCFFGPTQTFMGSYILAYPYMENDSIKYDEIWNNSEVMLKYGYWTGPNHCGSSTFDTLSRYLGVRLFTSTDTLYGWIKVKCGYNNTSITIEEYAVSRIINKESLFEFYPNPTLDNIIIGVKNFKEGTYTVKIFDVLGNLILKKILDEKYTKIDFKNYNKGIYFITMETDTESDSQKFTKL